MERERRPTCSEWVASLGLPMAYAVLKTDPEGRPEIQSILTEVPEGLKPYWLFDTNHGYEPYPLVSTVAEHEALRARYKAEVRDPYFAALMAEKQGLVPGPEHACRACGQNHTVHDRWCTYCKECLS